MIKNIISENDNSKLFIISLFLNPNSYEYPNSMYFLTLKFDWINLSIVWSKKFNSILHLQKILPKYDISYKTIEGYYWVAIVYN